MRKISDLNDDDIISFGSIIRMYQVGRFDIMKISFDRTDTLKREKDYYDYLLVDCSMIKDGSCLLINVSETSNNRGSILVELEEQNGIVFASQLKRYFEGLHEVFVI